MPEQDSGPGGFSCGHRPESPRTAPGESGAGPDTALGPVAVARLAEIRERNEQYIKKMALTEWTVTHGDPSGDVRLLAAAVEAALKRHPAIPGPLREVCAACRTQYGSRVTWPCAEYRAITAALTGEGGTGEGLPAPAQDGR